MGGNQISVVQGVRRMPAGYTGGRSGGTAGNVRRSHARPVSGRIQRQRRRRRAARLFFLTAMGAVAVLSIVALLRGMQQPLPLGYDSARMLPDNGVRVSWDGEFGAFTEDMRELLEKNEEAADYVNSYPERDNYKSMPIDLSQDFVSGEVPLLMQWDKRWGYDAYGSNMIGLAGCGPLCLDMAYLYFTEDLDMTPRKMAEFVYERGYYTQAGTSWSLWTDGAAELGLGGAELSLDENIIKRALDEGGLVVCSMRPGDFTTTGHFILLWGYDENGFFVNDPNRRSTSEKIWDFETLQPQIKNLWELKGSL